MYTAEEIDLSKYIPEFKSIAMRHVQEMNPTDLAKFRAQTKSENPASLDQLFSQAVGEIDTEFYDGIESREQLDEIEGVPVYFIPELGVYFWPCPYVPFCIDLWLTHPVYPNGW